MAAGGFYSDLNLVIYHTYSMFKPSPPTSRVFKYHGIKYNLLRDYNMAAGGFEPPTP